MSRNIFLVHGCSVLLFLLTCCSAHTASIAEEALQVGFSRVDITPAEPLRLSGYSDRDVPAEGIDEHLFVRATALKFGDGLIHVIASVETVGFPAEFTKQVHKRVREKHNISRSRFVLAATHVHSAPHFSASLDNIFNCLLSREEKAKAKQYADGLAEKIVQVVDAAIADMKPGRMYYAEGNATFALNRRVLKDGLWDHFGVRSDGPVDHSLPLLVFTDPSGKKVRGLVFNYACHCTTVLGDYNRVNGDWAGYAAKFLEQAYPEAVAISTIGCGADADPRRLPPERAVEAAQAHGQEIADEVQRLFQSGMTEITEPIEAHSGYAGLPIDRPPISEFKKRLEDSKVHVRRHANSMLALHKRMGRLPESYPMPIQVWKLGDQLTMVFLGGEVCVDYATRIKNELGKSATWVTAYANDVFGYVAPEAMRPEGGYEVDFSMIYYDLPGRWSTGTEDVILQRVHELYNATTTSEPLPADRAAQSFTVPDGFVIELVASEPLIADPVSFTFGPAGRLWVVEMGDYPRGANDDGKPGGNVKLLTDEDGDGRYDRATIFLEKLVYPTTALPWRDGVIVSSGSDIYLAKDTDGDGRADVREPIVTGFDPKSNPDYRPNTLYYGLDNWLYSTTGENTQSVASAKTGDTAAVSGRDVRFQPDSGRVQGVSGKSQWGRCRDDWGNWFGNQNGKPMWHFVLEDRYLQRNPFVPAPTTIVHLTDPPLAPPVYPTSRTVDRFNDLFDHNRFTSASSPYIFRDETLGPDMQGAGFICEPVHNLVSRLMIEPQGLTFRGTRHPSEQASEFCSSTDNWSRPCWVTTGPDGAIWIADIYRHVIEHPNWIPEAWQAQLDIYAGNDKGRIYRIYRKDNPPTAIPNLAAMTTTELVGQFESANGWRRDTAQQLLVQRNDTEVVPVLQSMAKSNPAPLARLHALTTLASMGQLPAELLLSASHDSHTAIVRWSVALWEERADRTEKALDRLIELAAHDEVRVRYQVALTLGEIEDPRIGPVLLKLALRKDADHWLRAAILSSARQHASVMLRELLGDEKLIAEQSELMKDLIATTLGEDVAGGLAKVVMTIAKTGNDGPAATNRVPDWQFTALASCVEAAQRRNTQWSTIAKSNPAMADAVEPLFFAARAVAHDDAAPLPKRQLALRLLGHQSKQMAEDDEFLYELLSPRFPPELQAASLQALADRQVEGLAEHLLQTWKNHSPKLQLAVASTLFSRDDWEWKFLDALESGQVPEDDVSSATRAQMLQNLNFDMRIVAHRIFGESEKTNRQDVIASYEDARTLPGDLSRGQKVFERVCSVCHRHGGIGVDNGPKLAALSNKTPETLLVSILDPNRSINDEYRNYIIVTEAGRTFSGLIKEETASSITLIEPNGKPRTILRIDIEEIINTGISFMPEGLEKELTKQDIADVMEFLRAAH